MKHILITTIAAVLVVGCGLKSPDISIHDASKEGNIDAVKQHIQLGANVDQKNLYLQTPLYTAVENGQIEIAKFLIENGANVNFKYVKSILQVAIIEDHEEIIETLLVNNADANLIRDGLTMLDIANKLGRKKIAKLLIKHGGKSGVESNLISIYTASKKGNIKIVKNFIKTGADINAKDLSGMNALHYACYFGRDKVVQLLLVNGAEVNEVNRDGNTSLDLVEVMFQLASLDDLVLHPETVQSGAPAFQSPLQKTIFNLLRKHGGKTGEELKAEGK